MAEITAKLVNELRSKTGQPMMDCKKMLEKTGGDMDAAFDEFRKIGVKASLTERAATEGRIGSASEPDGKSAALVEINCNTDFTAKSEPILALGARAATLLLQNPGADVSQNKEIADAATEVSQKTRENVRIGRTASITSPKGRAGLYIYSITGKIGVLMQFTGNPSDDLIKQIGGHIAFARPIGLTRADVPADIVAKEKEIAVEQAKATGKPQQIAEKIAEGKLNAFFAERVLLDQEFFNAQVFKGSVGNFLKANGVGLEKYIRLEVGQG
ncbi:MAG: translation elongation factor Ts [Tepidisphaeraceae bacterium]|jgi:elongation factor Ts